MLSFPHLSPFLLSPSAPPSLPARYWTQDFLDTKYKLCHWETLPALSCNHLNMAFPKWCLFFFSNYNLIITLNCTSVFLLLSPILTKRSLLSFNLFKNASLEGYVKTFYFSWGSLYFKKFLLPYWKHKPNNRGSWSLGLVSSNLLNQM